MTAGFSNVDWAQAPETARWWAIDGDGFAYWFCMPVLDPYSLTWAQEKFEAPEFGFTGDWQDSLTKRP